jgi:hypothetical protein
MYQPQIFEKANKLIVHDKPRPAKGLGHTLIAVDLYSFRARIL